MALGSWGNRSEQAQEIKNRLEEHDSLRGRCRNQTFDPGIEVTISHFFPPLIKMQLPLSKTGGETQSK